MVASVLSISDFAGDSLLDDEFTGGSIRAGGNSIMLAARGDGSPTASNESASDDIWWTGCLDNVISDRGLDASASAKLLLLGRQSWSPKVAVAGFMASPKLST
jgi:hypothetical protein